jgi:hypothetical protein
MRRFLANTLFIFLGLPLALSSLLLVSIRPWALDREAYKRIVTDDRLYAALLAPEMVNDAPETIELQAAGTKVVFDGSSLTRAAQKDLPWPAIKATAVSGVDAILDAVEGKGPGDKVELDLKPLKAALKAKSPAAARDYAAALAEETKAGTTAAGAIDSAPLVLAKTLSAAVDQIPDVASSPMGAPNVSVNGAQVGVLSQGPDGLSQAILNRMTATMAAVSALLLAGLGALGGTNLVTRLSRAGRYLLGPSIAVLALGVVLGIPGGLVLQNILPNEARAMIEGAAGSQLRDYLATVLGPIARGFFLTGLVGASVGGVLASSRKFSEPKELE